MRFSEALPFIRVDSGLFAGSLASEISALGAPQMGIG